MNDMQTQELKPTKPLIIVVDDQEPLRMLLRSVLSADGFRVLVASTGNEALRICARIRRPIAVMIIDVRLPGLSGFELGVEVARLRPRTPVLFISGAFRDNDPELRKRLGPGRDFLGKPFHLNSLASKLESMTSVPRSESRSSDVITMVHRGRSIVAMAVRRLSQRHVGEDDLESYSRGELSLGHAMAVKKHLLLCAQCRNALHELVEYASVMRQALLELDDSDCFASRQKLPVIQADARFSRKRRA